MYLILKNYIDGCFLYEQIQLGRGTLMLGTEWDGFIQDLKTHPLKNKRGMNNEYNIYRKANWN